MLENVEACCCCCCCGGGGGLWSAVERWKRMGGDTILRSTARTSLKLGMAMVVLEVEGPSLAPLSLVCF